MPSLWDFLQESNQRTLSFSVKLSIVLPPLYQHVVSLLQLNSNLWTLPDISHQMIYNVTEA